MLQEYIEEEIKREDFRGADFTKVLFEDTVFYQCDFTEAEFTNCIFRDCEFEECNWTGVKIYDGKIQGLSFRQAKIMGVNFAASGPGPSRYTFQECEMAYCTFEEMDLPDFVMEGGSLKESSFVECQLEEASFRDTAFADCVFERNQLKRADFRGASGYRFDPFDNHLKQARFSLPAAATFLDFLNIEIE